MPNASYPPPLSNVHADAIATLLNERNQLTVPYTRARVQNEAENYIYRLSEAGDLIACVEVKKLQWYQAEVLHLTVAAAHERKGYAKALLFEAEQAARANGARLLQCTIRTDNLASRKLFEGFSFYRVSTFMNQDSGNNVGVFQKVLATAR
jgi:ribosomal protein S18 acetylase RimI-like enzyme